jgi:hypothetical protein
MCYPYCLSFLLQKESSESLVVLFGVFVTLLTKQVLIPVIQNVFAKIAKAMDKAKNENVSCLVCFCNRWCACFRCLARLFDNEHKKQRDDKSEHK